MVRGSQAGSQGMQDDNGCQVSVGRLEVGQAGAGGPCLAKASQPRSESRALPWRERSRGWSGPPAHRTPGPKGGHVEGESSRGPCRPGPAEVKAS